MKKNNCLDIHLIIIIIVIIAFGLFTLWFFDDNEYDDFCRDKGFEKGWPSKILTEVGCEKKLYICEGNICVENGEDFKTFSLPEFELWKKVKKE